MAITPALALLTAWLGVAILEATMLAATGCAEPSERFHVRYASEGSGAPHTVSVLGALDEGLMTEEGWTLFPPTISRIFNRPSCEAGYGENLCARNPDLFSRIEQDARNSVDEELVAKVAPYAVGESVIVFEMHARPPGRAAMARRSEPVLLAHSGEGANLGNRPGLGVHSAELHPFELAAIVFSRRPARPVIEVNMGYFCATREDAIAKLAQKVAGILPGATCSGSNWPRSLAGGSP